MPGTLPLKCLIALWVITVASVRGDTVIVESKLNGAISPAAITPDPPYKETSGSWAYSSIKSIAPGCTPGVGARFLGTNGAFRVRPTLGEPGGLYFMDITFGAALGANNESTSVVAGLSAVGASLSTNSTTAFQFTPAKTNTWVRVGT